MLAQSRYIPCTFLYCIIITSIYVVAVRRHLNSDRTRLFFFIFFNLIPINSKCTRALWLARSNSHASYICNMYYIENRKRKHRGLVCLYWPLYTMTSGGGGVSGPCGFRKNNIYVNQTSSYGNSAIINLRHSSGYIRLLKIINKQIFPGKLYKNVYGAKSR